jgi:hypothetical protein
MKIPRKYNIQPYGLPFPSPKLHQDAKKKKNATFGQNRKCKKMQKMKVAFFPFPFTDIGNWLQPYWLAQSGGSTFFLGGANWPAQKGRGHFLVFWLVCF